MKLTNIHNLPQPILVAIGYKGEPNPTGWRVSELCEPVRPVILRRRHDSELEEDASERIWALLGTAIHYILSKGAGGMNALSEERLTSTINGITITGRNDLYVPGGLYDYKITSVWTAIYNPEGRKEWEIQDNLYKWLFEQHGFDDIKFLRNVLIMRDWVKSKANDKDYPKIPVKVIDIPMWDRPTVLDYLTVKVDHLEASFVFPDEQLPPCTLEDKWQRPEKFALMKTGRKRAVRLFDTHEAADKALSAVKGHYIELRPSVPTRCAGYCSVWKFCEEGRKVRS